jgi:hypothetical protein
MDFTLAKLKRPGPGNGVSAPPDNDMRGFPVEAAKEKPEAVKSAASGFRSGIDAFAYFFA